MTTIELFSVEEKLPEKFEDWGIKVQYLVKVDGYYGFALAWYNKGKKAWYTNAYCRIMKRVSHWAKLPEDI